MVVLVKMCLPVEPVQLGAKPLSVSQRNAIGGIVRSSKRCLMLQIPKFQVQISAAAKTEDKLAERDLRIVQCAMCNGRGDILC